MRNCLRNSCSIVLAGVAAAVTMLVQGDLNQALAQGGPGKRAPAAPAPVYNPDHQSTVRFTERDAFPVSRGIRVGRNKSAMIELPRELRDVVVSNPEMLDAVVQSSNRVFLIGKKVGQANIFLFDQSGEQFVTLEVTIEHDSAMLDQLFKRLIPGSNIKVEMINESVVLTGSVRNPADSNRASDIASRFITTPQSDTDTRHKNKVINLLQVEGEDQVMLQVVVAEVQRSILKQFGINLGAELKIGNLATAISTSNALPLTSASGLGKLPLAGGDITKGYGQGCVAAFADEVKAGVVANSGAYGTSMFGNSCTTHTLRALERDGLVRTLAEPNLTAVSGEPAKFLAGGEYPVPTVDNTGRLSVQYKEFGVGVAFTPFVLSEGRISLKIETEVSELTDVGAVTLSNISIPALKKRQAKSTVELPSGGTLALAGLINDDTRKNIDGMPGLKDVPMLGVLFRSQDFIKRETELVVLVTPYMVRPTAMQNFAKPTDGLSPASDLKSNFLGHMNRIYGKNAPAAGDGSIKDGSVGFIVD